MVSYVLICLLSDGIDNALSRSSEALALTPAHLLQEFESLVIIGKFVLLKRTLLHSSRTISQRLNSEFMKRWFDKHISMTSPSLSMLYVFDDIQYV